MSKVIIIAEVGVNHNGCYETAKKLIDISKDCGADIVKFQSYDVNSLIVKDSDKANYQKLNTKENETSYEMLKKLSLTNKEHLKLKQYSDSIGIEYLSSAFDIKSIKFISSLNLKRLKIPSGELNNLSYLREVAKLNLPIILSTGMCTLIEIIDAIQILEINGISKKRIIVLHCNTEYPTEFIDVNLKAMNTISKELSVDVGYSDHTKGIEVPIAAVALGAKVIEKHITLNKNSNGPDHKASTEPNEFKEMVSKIRNIELALSGDAIKKPSRSEQKNIYFARKSIVAITQIKKGEIFNELNIGVKRPGNGLSPMEWDNIIGRISKRSFNKDDLITI